MAQTQFGELDQSENLAVAKSLGAMCGYMPMIGSADFGTRIWYGPYGHFTNAGSGATVIAAQNNVGFVPFIPNFGPGTIAKLTASLALQVLISGGAGSLYRFGLYDGDQLKLRPTNLLFDSGQQDGTVVQTAIIPMALTLQAGRVYWLCYKWEVGSPTVRNLGGAAGTPSFVPFFGYLALSNQSNVIGWLNTQGAGALNATAGAVSPMQATNPNQMAHVMVEFA